ncbi:hypothetical protein IWX91DRAFT_347099 [Phyllosticta citricarpa]
MRWKRKGEPGFICLAHHPLPCGRTSFFLLLLIAFSSFSFSKVTEKRVGKRLTPRKGGEEGQKERRKKKRVRGGLVCYGNGAFVCF